jgi:putative oxidoreductase
MSQSAAMVGLGLLVLRLALAAVLVAHGSHTLFGAFADSGVGPGGLTATAAYFAGFGLTSPFLLALAEGVLQLAGGLLIGVGYFARWVSVPLAILEGLGIWKNSARWGFFMNWTNDPSRGHGMEFGVLLAGALVCLVLAGAGEWSFDGLRSRSAAARAAGRARLRDRS